MHAAFSGGFHDKDLWLVYRVEYVSKIAIAGVVPDVPGGE